MTDGAIKTGVIGLGYFGSFHARHHAANPKSQLVAVVDADGTRAAAAADQHGAIAFSDHRDLIGKVDAVSITVPTSLHHAVAGELIDAGIHVLIEKPIADTPTAARDLMRRADARGVVLQIGHIERFSPVFGLLRERVGRPITVECTRIGPWKGRAVDVDVVLDLMIHDIDLVLALVGSEVVEVEATGSPVLAPTNDFAHAQLRFADGTLAYLAASRISDRSERMIKVVDAERYWMADLAARTITSFGRNAGFDNRDEISVPPSDNLALEIDSFLQAVASKSRPVVDGKAGLDALTVADMIIRRIAEKPRQAAASAIGGAH
ncbi:Gfo/Idh/MocA family oxidoreductase [Kaistia dalseonensis]|uniref:Dehydrogenase n=1 Tax=Kaistia dalseonensis TaxID=410840 RepID=A0ABU0H148_9HYPH|nr:Gfo/Idh/MocA family oxidoreductase [Kaistia dalseonensis]MCX5493467.1 Gfo/Idh/MocA family oxidoreductase [Kaistia dalseonensis]MDQ0436026.1 putative dehydrogenase [Kaistia dalseonensis]